MEAPTSYASQGIALLQLWVKTFSNPELVNKRLLPQTYGVRSSEPAKVSQRLLLSLIRRFVVQREYLMQMLWTATNVTILIIETTPRRCHRL